MSVARRGESGAASASSYWRLRQRRIKSSTEATRRRWAAAARASRSRWAADRPGALLRRVQERAEIFQFGDQSVLGGDHTFGAFALALVVRPVPGRALLLGGKLGFELPILAFSVATTSVTGWPRGDRADKDLCRSSSRSIASSAAASPSSRRPPNDHR